MTAAPVEDGKSWREPADYRRAVIAATVREWNDEEGWGVLDSAETPGGCWAHFSIIEMNGLKRLSRGQQVDLVWEAGWQDGYEFRADRIVPQ